MYLDNSALQAAFGVALRSAQASGSAFAQSLVREGSAAWVWPQAENSGVPENEVRVSTGPLDLQGSLALAAEITTAMWFTDGQDARSVKVCPGIIAVDQKVMSLAREMNRSRRELAATLLAMEGRLESVGTDTESGEPIERPLREVAQEAFGAARLHYLQATRCIVTLERAPEYAGFTWANCRKVFRSTAGEIRTTLTDRIDPDRPDPLLLKDLKSLKAFKDSHPLAIVKPASLTPKVNLAWTDETGAQIRTIKRSVLPVLYVGTTLPSRLKPLRDNPRLPDARRQRNDVELEPNQFLATMHVHRYRQ